MSAGANITTQRDSGSRAAQDDAARRTDLGGKYLTFFLGNEEYGLEILKVQEIIGMMEITPVPRTPPHVRGVINLRGKVIAVVDLRLKFGMEAREQTDETCVIVVQAHGMQMGVVVDKVSEVLDIADDQIEEAPSFGSTVDTDYILGIGKSDGRVKLLLDIEKVLPVDELASLQLPNPESDCAEECADPLAIGV